MVGDSIEVEKLRVPTWLMSILVGGMLVVGGTAVKTWADTNSNGDAIGKHEVRLISVEGKIGTIQQDVAVIRQQMVDQKQHDRENSDKIDRILSIELARNHR
jgi:hypothetical protein